jgi:hypothetical protein
MFDLFQKSLDELVASDLLALRNSEEGWFIEYKVSLPDNQKVAKSVCSFANTYGGYLIIGAREQDKTRRLDSLSGMLQSDAEVVASKVAEAVAHHASPVPFFIVKIVDGPLPELGLAMDKSVVVIHVPESNRAPHVHSSGVIYRRVGDRSEPKPETDRATIDLMLAKSDAAVAQFEHHVNRSLNSMSSNSPQCTIILAGDLPIGSKSFGWPPFADFCRVASDVPVSLDSAYPSQTGYVARMAKDNDFLSKSPYQWEYDWYWNTHIFNIPLASFRWTGTGIETESTFDRLHIADFEKFLVKMKVGRPSVVEVAPLIFLLADALHKVQIFNKLDARKSPLKALIVFKNIAGTIPFLDTQQYIEQLETNGIPLIRHDTEFLSPIRKGELWLELASNYDLKGIALNMNDMYWLMRFTLPTLGIRSRAMVGEPNIHEVQVAHFAELVSNLSQRYFNGIVTFGNVATEQR